MHNPGDDKELDRLSREAAGKYTPPGKANWQALSEELDRIMPVTEKKKRRFLFWWLLPLLLVGGGAAYWMGTNQSTGEVTAVTDRPDAASVSGSSPIATKPANASGTPTAPTVPDEVQKKAQKNAGLTTVQPVDVPSPIASGLPLTKNIHTGKTKRQQAASLAPAPGYGMKKMAATKPSVPTANSTITPDQKIEVPTTVTQPVTEKNETLTTVQLQNTTVEKPAITATVTEPEPAKTEDAAPAPVVTISSSRGKGFSYAFVAGVDKSTVKFVYGNDPGINLGMMAGYHFSDRWSVHTGLIYTQKNYKVAGKDFTAPKGTWVSYYNLESITGYCRMWEVPLQVRYTMGKTENKSSFFSAGLSSYFMTKESYDYFYYYNNQPVTRNSTLSSADQHLFSIVHLSVGFENKVSKKWALQVEPYAKIPLGGVGFGSIRLSSFGLNFSLQHRQPAKK